MSRDWEMHVYFEHRPLTAALVAELLDRLADCHMRLDTTSADRFPALDGFDATVQPPRLLVDPGPLLRDRQPPVGAGYGVLPLCVALPDAPERWPAFLSFGRPHTATGLDSVSLAVDGAVAVREPSGMNALVSAFGALCQTLGVVYGWGDWETATFLVAAPTRVQARRGQITRFFRLNAFSPTLLAQLDADALLAAAHARHRTPDGALIIHLASGSELRAI